MSLQKLIYQFIERNDPTDRQTIIQEYSQVYAEQSIYRAIRNLLKSEQIFEDKRKNLSLHKAGRELLDWQIPAVLANAENNSLEILNAYSNRDDQLKQFIETILDNPHKARELMKLTIIGLIFFNTKYLGFHRASTFEPRELNRERLTAELKEINEKLETKLN